jgi:hypothetical protein
MSRLLPPRSRTQTALSRYNLRDIPVFDRKEQLNAVGFKRKRKRCWGGLRRVKRAKEDKEDVEGEEVERGLEGSMEVISADERHVNQVPFLGGNEEVQDEDAITEVIENDGPDPSRLLAVPYNANRIEEEEEEDRNSYHPSQPFKPRKPTTSASTPSKTKPLAFEALATQGAFDYIVFNEDDVEYSPRTQAREGALGYWQRAEQGMLPPRVRNELGPLGTRRRMRSPPINHTALEELAEREAEERRLGYDSVEEEEVELKTVEEVVVETLEEYMNRVRRMEAGRESRYGSLWDQFDRIDDEGETLNIEDPGYFFNYDDSSNLPYPLPPSVNLPSQPPTLIPRPPEQQPAQATHSSPSSPSTHYPSDAENTAPPGDQEPDRANMLPPGERRMLLGELRRDDPFDARTTGLEVEEVRE